MSIFCHHDERRKNKGLEAVNPEDAQDAQDFEVSIFKHRWLWRPLGYQGAGEWSVHESDATDPEEAAAEIFNKHRVNPEVKLLP